MSSVVFNDVVGGSLKVVCRNNFSRLMEVFLR